MKRRLEKERMKHERIEHKRWLLDLDDKSRSKKILEYVWVESKRFDNGLYIRGEVVKSKNDFLVSGLKWWIGVPICRTENTCWGLDLNI